jgi:hypothetical protein
MEDFWNDNKVPQEKFPNGVKFILICDRLDLPRRESDVLKRYISDEILTILNWDSVITRTKCVHEKFRKIARSIEEVVLPPKRRPVLVRRKRRRRIIKKK